MHPTRTPMTWRRLRRHIDRVAASVGYRSDPDALTVPALKTVPARMAANALFLEVAAGAGSLTGWLRDRAVERCEAIVATHEPAVPQQRNEHQRRPLRPSGPARRRSPKPLPLPARTAEATR